MTYPDITNTSVAAMAGAAGLFWGVVDSDGYPLGTTGSLTNGLDVGLASHIAVKEFGAAISAPEIVSVTGRNNRDKWDFAFRGGQASALSLNFGVLNNDFYAAITRTINYADGDLQMVGLDTDTDSSSRSILVLAHINAKDADSANGLDRWHTLVLPLVTVFPQFGNHTQITAMDWPYGGTVNRSSKGFWGETLSTAIYGYKRAAQFRFTGAYPLMIHVFKSNASALSFTLDYQPAQDATGGEFKVWREGTKLTPTTDYTVTTATKTVTLAAAGTAGQRFVVLYPVLPEQL